jgi:PhnB protein
MSITSLNPYLNFNGNAEQALKFYERVLDARSEQIMRFDQAPGMALSEKDKRRIMHCQLRIGAAVLMLSDTMPGQPAPRETTMHVVLHFSDVADLNARFDALAEGGTVSYPVHDAFFGAKFGMLVDQFGVPWMLICEQR